MIKPFWFRGIPNYGDILTPYILSRFNIKYRYTRKEECDSLFIGSIANIARKGVNVYGSGFIRKDDKVSPHANWHFVRGPLSRQMILDAGGKCPQIYGDLALMLPEFIKPAEKQYDIGYIPHHVEYNLFPTDEFKIKLEQRDVVYTTKEITKCRRVISSSLHGIITAMAYGIPAAYVSMSNKLSGDGMKFMDYYKSVGLDVVMSTIESPVFQLPGDIDMSEPRKIMEGLA